MTGRRIVFGLLLVGALLVIAEGISIGVRYVWLRGDSPLLFRLMLPGIFVGLGIVLALGAWNRMRARRAGEQSSAHPH